MRDIVSSFCNLSKLKIGGEIFMDVFKMFILHNRELLWHLTTIILSLLLMFFCFFILFFLYKTKRLSIYLTEKVLGLGSAIIIAAILFRTLYLHYALVIWIVLYLAVGFMDNKYRMIRYINYIQNKANKWRQLYQYIHNVNNNKTFLGIIKEYICLPEISHCDKKGLNKKEKAWKKSFLPFNYFVIGLVFPSLNLIVIGSQYYALGIVPLVLLECNILIFTILYYIYPIAKYCAVTIETGILFQNKKTFIFCYILFSFAVIIVSNGVLIINT